MIVVMKCLTTLNMVGKKFDQLSFSVYPDLELGIAQIVLLSLNAACP